MSPLLRYATLITIVLSFGYAAYSASATPLSLIDSDFKIFRRIAQIATDGRLAEAYDLSKADVLEIDYPTGGKVVPYTYPPLMSAVLQPLAHIPPWAGYVLWMLPGLIVFAIALARLSGMHRAALGVASAGAAILNISVGQNGLLFAGLNGLAAYWLIQQKTLPMLGAAGLLALKPHTALGIPFTLALRRQWGAVTALGILGISLTAAGFAFYGTAVAHAWLEGSRQATEHLSAGLSGAYPIERMVSVYAFLRTFGASHTTGLLVHGAVAILVIGSIIVTARGRSLPICAGLGLIGGLFASPYLYDYDLALLCIALAILVKSGVFDNAPRTYAAALAIAGLVPIPGAFSNWGILGDLKISVGAPSLLAMVCLIIYAVTKRRTFSHTQITASPHI